MTPAQMKKAKNTKWDQYFQAFDPTRRHTVGEKMATAIEVSENFIGGRDALILALWPMEKIVGAIYGNDVKELDSL